jgi:hypothetical protein
MWPCDPHHTTVTILRDSPPSTSPESSTPKSLYRNRDTLRAPLPHGASCFVHAVSHHFDDLLCLELASLLHLAAKHGVGLVSRLTRLAYAEATLNGVNRFPNPQTPREEVHLSAADTASLRAVPLLWLLHCPQVATEIANSKAGSRHSCLCIELYETVHTVSTIFIDSKIRALAARRPPPGP